ncbi:MAG: hypothetical protein Q9162_003155 [Coniocarpon cinnabarinum]
MNPWHLFNQELKSSRRGVFLAGLALFLTVLIFTTRGAFSVSNVLPKITFGTHIEPPAPSLSSVTRFLEHHSPTAHQDRDAHFHFLVPATHSNPNLCRLLLSAAATRFPLPVFVNWDHAHNIDKFKIHAAKIKGTLDHLNKLLSPRNVTNSNNITSLQPPQARPDDLALIIDGFDIWLQLPPEIFIQRYFSIIDKANERLRESLGPNGTELMREHELYQSIIFGPDKVCFPWSQFRIGCWAPPNSTLPEHAFGPRTDAPGFAHLARPRHLNSGTVMGPLEDMRKLYQATYERLMNHHVTDSDQFYFSELWGMQEFARQSIAGTAPPLEHKVWSGGPDGHWVKQKLQAPDLGEDQSVEFHVTLDYESELFQTVAFYDPFIDWTHAGSMTATGSHPKHGQGLPRDIAAANSPFAHVSRNHVPGKTPLPPSLSWSDMLLGRNIATDKVWGLIHFTPPKHWIDRWWFRMWYAEYGKEITENAGVLKANQRYTKTRDGRSWYPFVPVNASDISLGGGVADSGRPMDWDGLCKRFERNVFADAP